MVTESYLNKKAKFYARYLWDLELDVPVKINARLKRTEGQLYYGTYKKELQIAKNVLHTGYLLDDILLHELCHWYCYKTNKDHRDYSTPFENELKRIGASSTGTTELVNGKLMYRYEYGVYKCNICNKKLETKDYIDEKHQHGRIVKEYNCCNNKMYFSGIKYIPEDFIPNDKILNISNQFKLYEYTNKTE